MKPQHICTGVNCSCDLTDCDAALKESEIVRCYRSKASNFFLFCIVIDWLICSSVRGVYAVTDKCFATSIDREDLKPIWPLLEECSVPVLWIWFHLNMYKLDHPFAEQCICKVFAVQCCKQQTLDLKQPL